MASLGLSHTLDTRYRFKRAVDCDLTELESVIDYFAPTSERKGYWPHSPVPQDIEETYMACYEALREIDPSATSTIAQWIIRALADKEEGSSRIVKLRSTLAKCLEKIEESK